MSITPNISLTLYDLSMGFTTFSYKFKSESQTLTPQVSVSQTHLTETFSLFQ